MLEINIQLAVCYGKYLSGPGVAGFSQGG